MSLNITVEEKTWFIGHCDKTNMVVYGGIDGYEVGERIDCGCKEVEQFPTQEEYESRCEELEAEKKLQLLKFKKITK